jgi:transcriptional regulator with XRE-family HTH domain
MKIEVSVIRALRIARGMTQRDLAVRIGISASALSNLETGRGEASMALVARIASILECDAEDLSNGLVATYIATPIKVRAPEAPLVAGSVGDRP